MRAGEVVDIFEARSVFVEKYCMAKEWNARDLSWAQILEIRSQPQWNDQPQIKESVRTVVRRKGRELIIYEEGEFCCVCESTDYESLQRFGFGDPANPLVFMVCATCWGADGKDSAFHDWLAGEFERTMIVHDENRKLPDGRWTTDKHDPVR